MARLNVLISGGGIAGNAIALMLVRQGHRCTVVERFPKLRTSGLQIDLRGHGIEVLKRIKLEEAFRARAAKEEGMQIVDKNGRRRAFFPANKPGTGAKGGAQNFTSEYEIMRGDLAQLLWEQARDVGTKFIFGTSITSIESQPSAGDHEEVQVTFENGDKGSYDLLIGADGVHSRTRRMLLADPTYPHKVDPAHPNGFYPITGTYIGYFTVPMPIEPGEQYVATIYMATGGRGVMTRRNDPDNLQVYAGGKGGIFDGVKRGDVPAEKAAIRNQLQGAGWKVEQMLDGMDKSDNFYCERLGLVKIPKWSNTAGNVVLLGDAAYCPSVNTGMGTTSALVGAYVLSREIEKHCGGELGAKGLRAALEGYETKFRPFMDQVQEGVLEDKGPSAPSGEWGLTVFYWLAAVMAFFRVNVGSMMMKEKVKGWHLPAEP